MPYISVEDAARLIDCEWKYSQHWDRDDCGSITDLGIEQAIEDAESQELYYSRRSKECSDAARWLRELLAARQS